MEEKKWFIKERITDEEFINVCENSNSMASASAKMKMHFNSFKKRAKELNCYKPNQSGKGLEKKNNGKKIPLNEIIEGKHPSYQTFKLKHRLIKEGLKQNICEECSIKDWNGKTIEMELDHIDGNRTNHLLNNLRMLCPNCHSQTETYRGRRNLNNIEEI